MPDILATPEADQVEVRKLPKALDGSTVPAETFDPHCRCRKQANGD